MPRSPLPKPPARPSLQWEERFWAQDLRWVAGLDEAGRGALAGPVAVGAVILPPEEALLATLDGVRDSKQMTARQRAHWMRRIQQAAIAWAVGLASPEEIDARGIAAAIQLAASRALQGLSRPPQALLCDYGLRSPAPDLPQESLVRGDARSLSIAAASILGKVYRDRLLQQLAWRFPGYGLAQHKGYGTRAHRLALQRLGPTPIHRRSFRSTPPRPATDA